MLIRIICIWISEQNNVTNMILGFSKFSLSYDLRHIFVPSCTNSMPGYLDWSKQKCSRWIEGWPGRTPRKCKRSPWKIPGFSSHDLLFQCPWSACDPRRGPWNRHNETYHKTFKQITFLYYRLQISNHQEKFEAPSQQNQRPTLIFFLKRY